MGITAYEGLQRAGIAAGQTVLVHGGSGGVGHVALQLARHFGADVYATGGGEPQMALIEKLGATPINYKTQTVEQYVAEHTGGAGFDVVFDSVGGANMANSFAAAALNGQIASTVSMCELDLTTAHFKGLFAPRRVHADPDAPRPRPRGARRDLARHGGDRRGRRGSRLFWTKRATPSTMPARPTPASRAARRWGKVVVENR